jgi:hypothetical protein
MEYNTKKHWVSVLCPLLDLNNWKAQCFFKLNLFLSSGERKGTPILLGSLERANLNHWTTHVMLIRAI